MSMFDYGEEFRRNHAEAYADGDTPMTVFSSPAWALDYLMCNGGSGYLPERLIQHQLDSNTLFIVENAPEFRRAIYFSTNSAETHNRSWLQGLLTKFKP